MSSRSSWLIVLFRSAVSLLIFCLFDLSTTDRAVLKSPNRIVDLSISPFISIRFCFTYSDTLFLVTYAFNIFLENWLLFQYVMPFCIPDDLPCSKVCFYEINIATTAFLWLLLVWYNFFHPFTFGLSESLYLISISYRQNMIGYCFLSLGLSVSFNYVNRSFKFKVLI